MATYRNTIGPTIQFQNGLNAFIKGGGYGAAAGSAFGGRGTLIGAAIGSTLGAVGTYFNNKQMYKAGQAQLKAANTANKATLTQVARNISQINRQRTILSMQTQSALIYAQAQGKAQNASNDNLYAAADQIGNQALYLKTATQNMVDEQQYQSMFNLQTQQLNLNVQVQDLISNAKSRFVGVNVQGGDFDVAQALSDILVSVVAMAGNANFKGGGTQANTSTVNYDPSVGGYTVKPGSGTGFTDNWLTSSGTGQVVYGGYQNFGQQYSNILGVKGF